MKKNKGRYSWTIKITIATFFISVIIGTTTNTVLENVNIAVAFAVLLTVILLGILFDVIGISVTSATEVSFHAKSAQGLAGSRESIKLIRNAEKVSSFCNDVIGDIAGVVSGGLAAAIVTIIHSRYSFLNSMLLTLLMTGIVSALTVGGKALGKGFAMSQSEAIVTKVGLAVYYLKRIFTFQFRRKENR